MNVCFRAPTEELESQVHQPRPPSAGSTGSRGTARVGGMRASIYNACPRAAVEALVAFMKEFERANRGGGRAG